MKLYCATVVMVCTLSFGSVSGCGRSGEVPPSHRIPAIAAQSASKSPGTVSFTYRPRPAAFLAASPKPLASGIASNSLAPSSALGPLVPAFTGPQRIAYQVVDQGANVATYWIEWDSVAAPGSSLVEGHGIRERLKVRAVLTPSDATRPMKSGGGWRLDYTILDGPRTYFKPEEGEAMLPLATILAGGFALDKHLLAQAPRYLDRKRFVAAGLQEQSSGVRDVSIDFPDAVGERNERDLREHERAAIDRYNRELRDLNRESATDVLQRELTKEAATQLLKRLIGELAGTVIVEMLWPTETAREPGDRRDRGDRPPQDHGGHDGGSHHGGIGP